MPRNSAQPWHLMGGAVVGLLLCLTRVLVHAEESLGATGSGWHYGGFMDLSYAINFNFPDNHRWRNKSTTPRTNELAPNLVLGYLRKEAGERSRWGMELAVQGGYDTNALVPEAVPGGDKPVPGADTLRHPSRANVSYLAPIGNGLKLTAGLFSSYIGYESFYARENANYTRSYIADNSPYFMFGVGARYPIRSDPRLGLSVINGYSYLSRPNDQPSYGIPVIWRPTRRLTLTEISTRDQTSPRRASNSGGSSLTTSFNGRRMT